MADKKKQVLVVVAHADDMEFMAAGTVARFVDELGYDVYEYILTDNSRGSYRLTAEELIRMSAKEAVAAGEVLGLREVRFESYPDSLLNEENPNVIRDKIISYIREIKADIVMSWDPFAPGEDHPDHRVTAMATYEAAAFSANPCFAPNTPYLPRPVTEAYWFAKSPLNAECYVDIQSTIDKKISALLKHECQMILTLDGLVQEAKTLGVDLPMLDEALNNGHEALIEMGIRQYCAGIGEARGLAFAEQFRYEKLGALDKLFGLDAIKPDFA
jgi:LmbE family N-acetylglucosaminyl deacetylase